VPVIERKGFQRHRVVGHNDGVEWIEGCIVQGGDGVSVGFPILPCDIVQNLETTR